MIDRRRTLTVSSFAALGIIVAFLLPVTTAADLVVDAALGALVGYLLTLGRP